MSDDGAITIGDAATSVGDIANVARRQTRILISSDVKDKLASARKVVDRYIADDVPVYGLTTGLGAGVDTRLSTDDLLAFQARVPQARSVGVGPPLSTEETRAMMAVRLAGFVDGRAGVSFSVVESIADALNAGFHPVIPALGSIGAADLSPLAHMTCALMGLGFAELDREILDAATALSQANLTPLVLGPRDGHALVVGNSQSVGKACLCLTDIEQLCQWSFASIALNFEAFRSNLAILDERVLSMRPVFGQSEAAHRLRTFFDGSALWDAGAARRLQDPLSYRCVPQIWGALLHSIEQVRDATQIELSGCGENPVILPDDGLILPTSNFDMTALALCWEQLGLAIAHCASATAYRTLKIMSAGMTDLPRFLTPFGQSRTGFATAQKTVSVLDAEIRHLANPVSFPPLPAADGIEDHAALAPSVLSKTASIIERFRYLVAIELVVSAQAVELRKVDKQLGAPGAKVYRQIRGHVEPLTEDRAHGPDFQRIADFIGSVPCGRPDEPYQG